MYFNSVGCRTRYNATTYWYSGTDNLMKIIYTVIVLGTTIWDTVIDNHQDKHSKVVRQWLDESNMAANSFLKVRFDIFIQ
jgi:hypothetical protein